MKVESYELDVLHLAGRCNYGIHVAHCDAEFVFGKSGCYVCMGVGTHVRIDPKTYSGLISFLPCQLIDNLQFTFTLCIKAENVLFQSEINLPITFPNASIYDLGCREACR